MTRRLSRFLIVLGLILAWVAAGWVVIDALFADQDTLVGDSIAIGFALLAPIICLLGWAIAWVAIKTARRPEARA